MKYPNNVSSKHVTPAELAVLSERIERYSNSTINRENALERRVERWVRLSGVALGTAFIAFGGLIAALVIHH